jgi:hypothetical protein
MSTQSPERVSRHQVKTMEATLLAELLEEIRLQRSQTTSELAKLRSGIVNDVLSSGLVLLDAGGQYTESFFTPFGSLAVANHGTSDVVVQNGPPGQGAPLRGKGVHRVPAGLERVFNMSATEYTIYGAAGQALSVEVFARPQPPTSGGAGGLGVATPQFVEVTDGAGNAIFTVATPGRVTTHNRTTPFTESTTPLGIGATFTGPTRSTAGYGRFVAIAAADQAGTLNVEQSVDGATWMVTDTIAVAAGVPQRLNAILGAANVRVRYVNGGVAQGSFTLASELVGI